MWLRVTYAGVMRQLGSATLDLEWRQEAGDWVCGPYRIVPCGDAPHRRWRLQLVGADQRPTAEDVVLGGTYRSRFQAMHAARRIEVHEVHRVRMAARIMVAMAAFGPFTLGLSGVEGELQALAMCALGMIGLKALSSALGERHRDLSPQTEGLAPLVVSPWDRVVRRLIRSRLFVEPDRGASGRKGMVTVLPPHHAVVRFDLLSHR